MGILISYLLLLCFFSLLVRPHPILEDDGEYATEGNLQALEYDER